MKIYKNLLIGLMLNLACLAPLFGQDKNVDATYLLLKKEYRFHRDGSYDLTYEHRLQYHTYYSFHRLYGETFVVYNPNYQTISVTTCETTMADGKKVVAPQNAFNEVLPSWAAQSPNYNGMRELVITHTGLEREAVAHLKYTLTSKSDGKGFWHFAEPLLRDIPVKNLEISFVFPKEVEFSFVERAYSVKPQILQTDDTIRYTFSLSNVPMKDPMGLVDEYSYPMVIVQVGEKDLFQFLSDMGEQSGTLETATRQMLDTALLIRNQIGMINTVPVHTSFQQIPVQEPSITFNRNSGTRFDKAVLLAYELRKAEIPCKLALKIPSAYFQPENSNLDILEDAMVLIKTDHGFWALSVDKNQHISHVDLPGYVLAWLEDGKLGLFYDSRPRNAESRLELTMFVEDGKATFNGKETARYTEWAPKLLIASGEKVNAKHVSNLKGEVEDFVSDQHCGMCYTLSISDMVLPTRTKITTLPVPTLKYGFDFSRWKVLPDSIVGPLRIGGAGQNEQQTIEILLPPKARLFTGSRYEKRSGRYGEIEVDLKQQGNKIIFTRKISLKSSMVMPDQYQEFKEAMKVLNSDFFNQIAIELL